MSRASGANAKLAIAFETIYGTPPGSGFKAIPFVSDKLGETQGLVKNNLLGLGPDPQRPGRGRIDAPASFVVPVDLRNFGYHLKAMFGAPTTTQGIAATGSYTSNGTQPVANSTITVNGTVMTFVAANPTASQILIGATAKDTVANAVRALNASTDNNIKIATYSTDDTGLVINITHDTIGTAGNSFTIVAGSSPATSLTASGATLSGGATSGPYNHVFVSGASDIPSLSAEGGNPEVPFFGMNYGGKWGKLAIPMQADDTLLDATIDAVFQGDAPYTTTQAGTPTVLDVERFSQFSGAVSRSGVPISDVVNASFNYDNKLDIVRVLRRDGRIAGVAPGVREIGGQIVTRFGSTELFDLAQNGTPVDINLGWLISSAKRLDITLHQIDLPKPQKEVNNDQGIQATFDYQASKSLTVGRAVTATLVNDVSSY